MAGFRLRVLFPEVHVFRAQAVLQALVVRMVLRLRRYDVDALGRVQPAKGRLGRIVVVVAGAQLAAGIANVQNSIGPGVQRRLHHANATAPAPYVRTTVAATSTAI